MERFTISLDATLADEFDRLIAERGYANRSEAVRDLIRRDVEAARLARPEAEQCVSCVSYVYNHHERRLAGRIAELQHAHHDLTIASMHAHLDHEHCIETVLLRGATERVRECAERLLAERGVRHGQIHMVPVLVDGEHDHAHGESAEHGHGHDVHHQHVRPAT